jgi:vacuolar-type H+-ATPase subunit I/STV1
MWVVWLVTGGAIVAFLGAVALFRPDFQDSPRGWQLLAGSGVALAIGGLIFIIRFWEPTPGPYLANELYPLGPYLNAWAVSFGFAWLGFGLLFVALALTGARWASRRIWFILLTSWFLCWLPHGIIGIGFAWAGQNAPSIQRYRAWTAHVPGLIVLCASAVVLLGHFALSIVGFIVTWRELWRGAAARGPRASLEASS